MNRMLLGGVKESLNTDIPAAVKQLQLFTYSEEQRIAAFHLESTEGSLRPSPKEQPTWAFIMPVLQSCLQHTLARCQADCWFRQEEKCFGV